MRKADFLFVFFQFTDGADDTAENAAQNQQAERSEGIVHLFISRQ